jgi:hypothetical protein
MLITQVLLNRFYFCLKINQIGCFGWFQCSAQPPVKKTAGQIEKETNNSPRSSQRSLRKKIKIISV